jgi:hypothetical protein
MGEDLSIKVETLSKILNPAIDMWVSGHEIYEIAINTMQDWERESFVDSVIARIKINEGKSRNNMR